jgi:hypothetical protein
MSAALLPLYEGLATAPRDATVIRLVIATVIP